MLVLIKQPAYKEKSECKLAVLPLKIDFGLIQLVVEGLGKYIQWKFHFV